MWQCIEKDNNNKACSKKFSREVISGNLLAIIQQLLRNVSIKKYSERMTDFWRKRTGKVVYRIFPKGSKCMRPWSRLQNSRFRKAASAVSVILECEAREPHPPAGSVRRENDCRLFLQRIRSKEGLYNITEVTEFAWQLHPHLKFDSLDALFSREICCVVIEGVKFRTSVSVFL